MYLPSMGIDLENKNKITTLASIGIYCPGEPGKYYSRNYALKTNRFLAT